MVDDRPNPLARAMWRYDDEDADVHSKEMKIQMSRNNSLETLGPIGLVLSIFFVIHLALVLTGIEKTTLSALLGTVFFVGLWFWFKKKRRDADRMKAAKLRKQLSELEEVEFKLRYEEAKMNGKLDRWNKNDDHNDDK